MKVTPDMSRDLAKLYAGLDTDTIQMIQGKKNPGYKGESISISIILGIILSIALIMG